LVTFDSNVWRPAAAPVRFPNDPAFSHFVRINQAIRDGEIGGRLSETVFTLEAITRVGRRAFFSGYKPKISFRESVLPDGTIQVDFSIGPDTAAHPGNNPYLSTSLADALGIGFRLMRCPRVAGAQNPDLRDEWFGAPADSGEIADKFGEVARRIESCGAGQAVVKRIGAQYAPPNEHWSPGLANAPPAEEDHIAEAVAEWADGDSIAAHVAYGNDVFCTRDRAVGAGAASVLSATNRAWLERDYGVKFALPEEICRII